MDVGAAGRRLGSSGRRTGAEEEENDEGDNHPSPKAHASLPSRSEYRYRFSTPMEGTTSFSTAPIGVAPARRSRSKVSDTESRPDDPPRTTSRTPSTADATEAASVMRLRGGQSDDDGVERGLEAVQEVAELRTVQQARGVGGGTARGQDVEIGVFDPHRKQQAEHARPPLEHVTEPRAGRRNVEEPRHPTCPHVGIDQQRTRAVGGANQCEVARGVGFALGPLSARDGHASDPTRATFACRRRRDPR